MAFSTTWTKFGKKKSLLASQFSYRYSDLEKIKIFACDQLLYENKEFLLKADFQTDGELDPLVIEAVKVVKEKTDKMVDI